MHGTTEEQTLSQDDLKLLSEASNTTYQLLNQIGEVIVGQEAIVQALLCAVFSRGHVLIVGVPGLAKTLLVKTLSEVLGWDFQRIQFTPDMMPSDITGMELLQFDEETHRREMSFVPGPIFANLILGDEINRTPPKTQSALLEAMQEYNVTSMGKTYPIEQPFLVVATQNPIEQEGTYPLPEAQLDRFMFSLWVDYPSKEEEELIVMKTTAPQNVSLSPLVSKERLIAIQELVYRLPVSQAMVSYAVSLARATRPGDAGGSKMASQYIEWGAGPRASQHMILSAKAFAVMEGESTVSKRHIDIAAMYVLRHRVVPNYHAAGEGLTSADILKKIIKEIPSPVE